MDAPLRCCLVRQRKIEFLYLTVNGSAIATLWQSHYNRTMFFRAVSLLLIVVLGGCSHLPFTSSEPAHGTPENEEARISRQFRREVKKQLTLVSNPEIEGYVNQVGRRILSVMGALDFDYRFTVISDPSLNAFSVPGGSIYIYSGLLERAKTTNEVAGVTGHEI